MRSRLRLGLPTLCSAACSLQGCSSEEEAFRRHRIELTQPVKVRNSHDSWNTTGNMRRSHHTLFSEGQHDARKAARGTTGLG